MRSNLWLLHDSILVATRTLYININNKYPYWYMIMYILDMLPWKFFITSVFVSITHIVFNPTTKRFTPGDYRESREHLVTT